MSETDRLRDLLEQAAPENPDVDPTSRAAAVARRGRHARVRDRVLVAAAAVAVATAVTIPFVTSDRGDETSYPTTTPPVAVEPCPAGPVDPATLGPVAGLGEVVAVRACPAQGTGEALPAEPLTGAGAQAFAEDVAALPGYQLPSFCMVATVMPEPWALQVQTADGELLTLGSSMRTCSSVQVDGVDRGVDGVVAAFAGNLAGVPDELACPQDDADAPAIWNASFDPATATAGILCVADDGGAWVSQAVLTTDEVAGVKDDMATNLRQALGGACDQPVETPRLLVLADDAGDQAAYVDLGCGEGFTSARGTWVPGSGTLNGLTG
ncbi:hypothetical protein [Nocardioides caricicola]|uniref:Uncharacterized protein n=1 Tax=Nocardioides caricicola TaxID=634770 RepID=A0ABW0N201_9ACTN